MHAGGARCSVGAPVRPGWCSPSLDPGAVTQTGKGQLMATAAETAAMRRALELAASPDFRPGPNPRVGAVLLGADGQAVGEGHHRGAGTAHAEVEALAGAGPAARGGTAVVTLEPCSHTGRTGPCAEALRAAGVRRVVFAQQDPNPVAAGGAALLAAAGVEVEAGLLAAEATRLNLRWSAAVALGRPFVTWKLATTLDGRSAAADGTSRWLSGPAARADVHRLRAGCDTILVGTGTVALDDPWLTVRDGADVPLPPARQPRRAVMGIRPLAQTSRVFDSAADTVRLRTHDPAAALADLYAAGSRQVWLEGGPTLAAAFLRADLVDEVICYVTPGLLGAGLPAVGDLGIGTIADIRRLDLGDVTRVGDDVRLTLRPTGGH